MKILFCANIYESGIVGPARFAEGLTMLNDLYKGKFELKILTADVTKETLMVYKYELKYPRFLKLFDFLFRGYAYYKEIRSIKKEFQPDVILFGNSIYSWVTKKMLPNSIIMGMVNDDHLVAIQRSNFLKFRGGKSLLFLKQVEKISCKSLDKVIVCSNYLKKLITKTYDFPAKKCTVLYQGINLSGIDFIPQIINPTQEVKILFVKHRYDLGGLKVLSEALKMINEVSFKLSIIGPSLKERDKILSWFSMIKSVKPVFIGPASQKEVFRCMRDHHILCIPSILEAQGLANVEGMAHGIQVVSSNTGGIPEVLGFGKFGLGSEPGNPVSLSASLLKCIHSSKVDQYSKINLARQNVESSFTTEIMLSNFIKIIEAVESHAKEKY